MLYKEKHSIYLRICSRGLYKAIAGKSASVESFRKGVLVLRKDPNGQRFTRSAKQDYVRLALTKQLSKHFKTDTRINVVFKGFPVSKVVQYDIAYESSLYDGKDIPDKVYWVRSFLRKTSKRGMGITLHRKPIAKLAEKSIVRVLFQKTPNGILLRKSDNPLCGRKLYASSRNRRTVSYVTEIAYPKELEKYFTGIIGIPITEFGLKPSDFSMDEFEGALLIELEKRDMKVYPGTTQTTGDIILADGGYVEVTTSNPAGRRNSRHMSTIMQIRGRLFEAEHMAIHRGISPIFYVIHSTWLQNEHLMKEVEEAKKHGVYTIFTDFRGKWASHVAQKIAAKYSGQK
jgi:hypothetical protein